MQNSKEYNEKRNEILDAAEKLFSIKGYEKCSVNNILSEVGIAKGTFYYYFKSKEEVLDSVVSRVNEIILERAEIIASSLELSPVEKIINVILSMNVQDEIDHELMEGIHKPENALIHQKSLTQMVKSIIPIFDKITQEGIEKGIFKSQYPTQYMQIFLTSSMTLLDEGVFRMSQEEQQLIIIASLTLLDKMLGVEDGTFLNASKNYYE